jgi:hypothetical protein
MIGDVAATAFIDLRDKSSTKNVALGIAGSEDGGLHWRDHGDLPAPRVDETKVQYHTPIIKLADARRGYIAYLGFRPGNQSKIDVHVIRIRRDLLVGGGLSNWSIDGEILRVTDIEIAPKVPTGIIDEHVSKPKWRDGIPLSFDLGDVGASPHLYVAWRQNGTSAGDGRDPSQVWLADCIDGSNSTCFQGTQGGGWRIRRPEPDRIMQYQPVVTATRTGGGVALSWYQSNDANEFVHRLNMRGLFSLDAGNTLSAPLPIRPPLALDWAPCPRLDGYCGDYIASTIVPGRTVSGRPWIVTAYADSSYSSRDATATTTGCEQTDFTAYDQHVQATVW